MFIQILCVISSFLGIYIGASMHLTATVTEKDLQKKSAANNIVVLTGVATIGTVASFVLYSAFLFGVGIYTSDMFTPVNSISVNSLIRIIESTIQNSQNVVNGVTTILQNPQTNQASLVEMHEYLTAYITSHEIIYFDLLLRVNYLERLNDPDFFILEDVFGDYREVSNNLLEVYRAIEGRLGITIDNSPVPQQDPET